MERDIVNFLLGLYPCTFSDPHFSGRGVSFADTHMLPWGSGGKQGCNVVVKLISA